MIVVCDASPIIALACAGWFDLLHAVHGEILIPGAVFNEINAEDAALPGAREVADAAWVKRKVVRDRSLVDALSLELDPGEAETIALAVENRADLILLDERQGRHAARRLGLTVSGTLGVVIVAKDRGVLASVRPVLDALRAKAGFWIGDDLYNEVLAAAKE